jgi:transposase
MEQAKEILRLSLEMGLNQRDVASGTGCSLGMVNMVLSRVKESGVSDPLSLNPKELGSIIYPPSKEKDKGEPDYRQVDKELKRKGVTLYGLWEEYKLENPDGFMYTQFCAKYRKYRKQNSVYMRKIYKAGERMMVDWAGLTMSYNNCGNKKTVYVFVAVLPASSIIYAHPFGDMKMESWIQGHVQAFEYFGGVTQLVEPDNAKTAVIKASRYEPEINRTYQEMARHYRAAVVPTRPYAATDKAPVETAVQIVERRIIVKLRHTQFLSLNELAEAFHAELEALNDQPFQKLPGSRLSVFLETEQPALRALPAQRYEYAHFKEARAGFDYHVALDKAHFYSIPYQYAGKMALIRWNLRTVEVFCEGERIACHMRNMDGRQRYTTDPAHMPERHKAVSNWSPARFTSWAAKTGEQTKRYIAWLLERKEHPEQAYRTCAGILRLASKVKASLMESACAKALEGNVYSYSGFAAMLEHLKDEEPILHKNLRGENYYQGGIHNVK